MTLPTLLLKQRSMNWKTSNNKYVILGIVLLLVVWGITNSSTSKTTDQQVERARSLYANGQIDDAARELAELAAKSPRDAQVWNNLGNALRDQKKYQEASEAYQQAIQLNSRYEAAYRNLAFLHIDMEQDEKQVGKIDEAITLALKGFKATGSKSVSIAEDLVTLYIAKGDEPKAREYKAIRDKLLES